MEQHDPNLEIPPFLRRAPSDKEPPREVGEEVRQRREAHRIAVACRRLLERERRRQARERKRRSRCRK